MMAKAELNAGQILDALINHNLLESTPNAHTSCSDLIRQAPLTRYKAALNRRGGGSRSAAGGRAATVLCGARGPRAGST
jgi:hypothetical protein